MKHLVTFLTMLAFTASATNIRFNIGTITGGQTNLSFTVQGLVMPFGSTNFVVTGYPMRFTPSSGTITTNLVAGNYRLTFIGPSPAQTVDFAVTNSASTLDVSDLCSWTLSKFTASQYYTIDQANAQFAAIGTTETNAFRVLNVKELGAVGDGATDDTIAIQNAINLSTNSALPSSVYFPPGRYKVTSALRIWPNDTHQNLGARTGPTKLMGDGSGVSIIESYVTNGAAVDARIDALDGPGLVGFTMERLGIYGPIGRGAWTNDASEGLALGRSNAVHWTGTNWITEGYGSQYYGNQIRVQDCDFSGFTKAIGSTNVWGFVVDGTMFHSNRLHALAFNCTHSVSLRNVSVYGIAVSNRLTDIAIGFFAPVEAPSWWGFGDTAEMHQTQVQWARVGVFNNELSLHDVGANFQFVDLGHQIRSGQRTNGSNVEIWRPYADIIGATYCDSYFPWVTNSPAMVEIDSYVAPRVSFYQIIGDVCKNVRPKVNIIGATATGSGNNGTLTFGTATLAYPDVFGGAGPWPAVFNGATAISLAKLTNSVAGSSGTITNNQTGVTLGGAFSGSYIVSDGGSELSVAREGDTTALYDWTLGDYVARQTQTNWQFYLPLVGNASGLTNFSRAALAASGAVTNSQSTVAFGTIIAGDGGFNGDGQGLTNVPSLQNGTKSLYFSNPNTWTTAQDFAASNATFAGTITGNGSGLTNLTAIDNTVAFWGDSLTLGLSLTIYSNTPGWRMVMRGVGGETSTQILSRMLADTQLRSAATVIWAGANDGNPYAQTVSNVAQMVSSRTTPDYVVMSFLVNSNYPIGTATYTNAMIANSNLAVAFPGHFLDIFGVLTNGNPLGTTATNWLSDAIHLNTAGYSVVATNLAAWIRTNWHRANTNTYPVTVTDAGLTITMDTGIGFNGLPEPEIYPSGGGLLLGGDTRQTGYTFLRSARTGGAAGHWLQSLSAQAGSTPIPTHFYIGSGGNREISILTNGYVGIKNVSPSNTLDVVGNVKITGNQTNTGTLTASNVVATGTSGSNYFAGSLFGSSGTIACTTQIVVNVVSGTYTNALFSTADYVNVSGAITASTDGSMTNLVAGRYCITINTSFSGAGGSTLYEGAVFTNNVECTVVEWLWDVTSASTGNASASGILTLPANTRIGYRIKNGGTENATFKKLSITVMGAN